MPEDSGLSYSIISLQHPPSLHLSSFLLLVTSNSIFCVTFTVYVYGVDWLFCRTPTCLTNLLLSSVVSDANMLSFRPINTLSAHSLSVSSMQFLVLFNYFRLVNRFVVFDFGTSASRNLLVKLNRPLFHVTYRLSVAA